jgi:hypothetical protein
MSNLRSSVVPAIPWLAAAILSQVGGLAAGAPPDAIPNLEYETRADKLTPKR